MFKKLKNKISEEVQQTSLRLPVSVQQSVQQLSSFVSSAAGEDKNNGFSNSLSDDLLVDVSDIKPAGHNKELFSIDEDYEENSAFASEDAAGTIYDVNLNSAVTSPTSRSRRDSASSSVSDASSLFPIRDVSNVSFSITPSDLESASEWEETSGPLEKLSKDTLYQAYVKMRQRYHKYKGRHADLSKVYKDKEKENEKLRDILTKTQDSTLRKISELREQCTLEQHAKAHLEQELRSEIEECEHKIAALSTQNHLLQEGYHGEVPLVTLEAPETKAVSEILHTSDDLCVDNVTKGGSEESDNLSVTSFGSFSTIHTPNIENEEAVEKLKGDVIKCKRLLARCMENIKGNKEKIASITQERDIATNQLQEKLKLIDTIKENHEKELQILKADAESSAFSMAETKRQLFDELQAKEAEAERLNQSLAALEKSVQEGGEESEEIQLSHLKSDSDCLKERVKNKIQELESKAEELKQSRTDLEMQVTELIESKSCLEVEQSSLRKINFELEGEVEILAEENNRIKGKIQEMENLANYKESKSIEISHLFSKISGLESANDELEKQIEKFTDNEKNLHDELLKAGNKVKEIESNCEEIHLILEDEGEKISKLESENSKLEEVIKQHVDENSNLNVLIDSLNIKISEQALLLLNATNEIKELQNCNAEQQTCLGNVQQTCDRTVLEYHTAFQKLKEDMAHLKENEDNFSVKIEQLQEENKFLIEDLNKYRDDNINLKSAVENLQSELVKAENKLCTITDEAFKELSSITTKMDSMKAEFEEELNNKNRLIEELNANLLHLIETANTHHNDGIEQKEDKNVTDLDITENNILENIPESELKVKIETITNKNIDLCEKLIQSENVIKNFQEKHTNMEKKLNKEKEKIQMENNNLIEKCNDLENIREKQKIQIEAFENKLKGEIDQITFECAEKLKESELTIEVLKEKWASLENKLNEETKNVNLENISLTEKVELYENNLEIAKKQMENLQMEQKIEIEKVNSKNAELNEKLKEADFSIKDFWEKYAGLESKLLKENDIIKLENESLHDELRQLEGKSNGSEEEERKNEIKFLKSQNLDYAEKLRGLSSIIKTLEENDKHKEIKFTNEIENIKLEKDKLSEKLSVSQDKIVYLQNSLKIMESDMEDSLESITAEFSNLERTLLHTNSVIHHKENEILRLLESETIFQSKLSESEEVVNIREVEMTSLTEIKRTLENNINSLDNQLTLLKNEKDNLLEDNKILQDSCCLLKDDICKYVTINKEITKSLNEKIASEIEMDKLLKQTIFQKDEKIEKLVTEKKAIFTEYNEKIVELQDALSKKLLDFQNMCKKYELQVESMLIDFLKKENDFKFQIENSLLEKRKAEECLQENINKFTEKERILKLELKEAQKISSAIQNDYPEVQSCPSNESTENKNSNLENLQQEHKNTVVAKMAEEGSDHLSQLEVIQACHQKALTLKDSEIIELKDKLDKNSAVMEDQIESFTHEIENLKAKLSETEDLLLAQKEIEATYVSEGKKQQNVIEELQLQFRESENKCADLEKHLDDSKVNSSLLETQLVDTRSGCMELNEKVTGLDEINEQLSRKIEQLEYEREASVKTIAVLEFNNEHNRNKVNNMELSNQDLREKIEALNNEISELKTQTAQKSSVEENLLVHEKEALQNKFEEEVKAFKEEINGLLEVRKSLEKQIQKIEDNNAEMHCKLGGTQEERDAAKKAVAELTEQNLIIQKELTECKKIKDELNVEVIILRENKIVLSQELEINKEKIHHLGENTDTLQHNLINLQKQVNELHERLTDSQKDVENLESVKKKCENVVLEVQSAFESLKTDSETTKKRLNEVLSENEDLRIKIETLTEASKLNEKITSLTLKIEELESYSQSLKFKLDSTVEANGMLKEQIINLKVEVAAGGNVQQYKDEIDNLNSEKHNLLKRVETVEDELKHVKDNLEMEQSSVLSLKNKVKEKEIEEQQLQTKLKSVQEKLQLEEIISSKGDEEREKSRELETKLANTEEKHRDNIKQLADECQNIVKEKEREYQESMFKIYEEQELQTSSLVKQHREALSGAQEEINLKSEAFGNLVIDHNNKIKEKDEELSHFVLQYEDQLAKKQQEHEHIIKEIENAWKAKAEKQVKQRETELRDEMNSLVEEWTKERKIEIDGAAEVNEKNELERLTQVAAAAFRSGTDSVELLKKQVATQRKELEEVKQKHKVPAGLMDYGCDKCKAKISDFYVSSQA